MDKELALYLEKIFRDSSSSDELFDSLNLALTKKVDSLPLYKILLANQSLSKDELIMYTEKITDDFVEHQFDLYMWLAKIFETFYSDYNATESSLYYYQKAHLAKPDVCEPLTSALTLYNYEIDYPVNKKVLKLVNTALPSVKKKSVIFGEMAKHYKKTGKKDLFEKFMSLAEKSSKKENYKK
ncbi:MAG: hypothetical protein KJ799_11700 [Bacteroidetes bacterium]|nr:hypothetical protein [Bacteroidota bacterium]